MHQQDFGVERDRYGRILRDGVPHGEIGVGGRGGHPRGGDMARDGRRGFLGDGPPSEPAVPPEAKYTNTYGLNVSFLESLGIDGPLVNRVFVANVSRDRGRGARMGTCRFFSFCVFDNAQ